MGRRTIPALDRPGRRTRVGTPTPERGGIGRAQNARGKKKWAKRPFLTASLRMRCVPQQELLHADQLID